VTELYLFAAAFVTVFALGFQQQNVLWRAVPIASAIEILATLVGGPVGIVAAMYVHPRLARRWGRR
jgi:uncharacterized membrane protein YfcA